jgi:hypothetical protein
LVSIGDRAFFKFNGGDFSFNSESFPKLEFIGVQAFASFAEPVDDVLCVIQLKDMPSLIKIGDLAFNALSAPFMLLQVECACSSLEVIGESAFASREYGSGSKLSFTDLSRLRTIGDFAFYALGNTGPQTELEVAGVSPLLREVGNFAFR